MLEFILAIMYADFGKRTNISTANAPTFTTAYEGGAPATISSTGIPVGQDIAR